jgi:dynein heavy chain 1, cytosolic
MRTTLANLMHEAFLEIQDMAFTPEAYLKWIDKFPTQLVVLTAQVVWTHSVDKSLADGGVGLDSVLKRTENLLNILADAVLEDLNANLRKKYEHLLTELVHQRDVIRQVCINRKSTRILNLLTLL